MNADRTCGGVIFDADGALLDTNYLHIPAWWEVFRERGPGIRCAMSTAPWAQGHLTWWSACWTGLDATAIEAHQRHFTPYLGRMRPLPGAAADGSTPQRGSG